jgi:hypothetical protein
MAAYNAPEHPEAVAPRPLQVKEREDGQLVLRLPAHSFATVSATLVGSAEDIRQASRSAAAVGSSLPGKPCLNC